MSSDHYSVLITIKCIVLNVSFTATFESRLDVGSHSYYLTSKELHFNYTVMFLNAFILSANIISCNTAFDSGNCSEKIVKIVSIEQYLHSHICFTVPCFLTRENKEH